MSMESFSSGNYPEYDNTPSDETVTLFSLEIMKELFERSNGYPREQQYRDKCTYITTGAVLSQIETLGKAIARVTREQQLDDQPFLLIDPRHFATLEQSLYEDMGDEFRFMDKHQRDNSIVHGMRIGTDIVLSKLVPKDFRGNNADVETTFFTPLRKDLLNKTQRMLFTQHENGGCDVLLPTNLLNTFVTHTYGPDIYSMPSEELRLMTLPQL